MELLARSLALVSLTAAIVLSTGCSQGDRPPLGYVSGTVTIDGEPLRGVIVAYLPDQGRTAVGTTDENGKYEIEYLQGVKGCKVGPSTIGFMAPTGGSPSHAIPPKYENKSEFKVDVKAGNNKFDFNLESDGKAEKHKPKPKSQPGVPLLD